jgi:hypothetical protein
VDNSVDNFAISVDNSPKSVDNCVDNFLPLKKVIHRKIDLSTFYPQTYPQEKIFQSIESIKIKKSYPQKIAFPNNNNLLIYKKRFLLIRKSRET